MSQIINPERRDPGYLKNKADVGLSRADNYSLSEIQDLVHGALREEYAKGDIYGVDEIKSLSEFLIPLCEFKDKSSRATITLGFINSSKEVISFVRANAKYSFLNDGSEVSKSGETSFSVELDTSSERILPGEFRIYKTNDKCSRLYLYLPKNLKKGTNLFGITINITEEIVTGEGIYSYNNIEVLNSSNIKFPEEIKDLIEYSIPLGKSDRDTSSYSRSLAIYDGEDLHYPDNFYGEDLNSDLNFPKINGVPFTGDKNLTHEGNSLRDITIAAKHTLTDESVGLDKAGSHKWEVLTEIPVNKYNEKLNQTFEFEPGISNIGGLSTIVSIPDTPANSNNVWTLISNLKSIVASTSQGHDEHVISIGFLRKFTDYLSQILLKFASADISLNLIREEDFDSGIISTELQISPNYNNYVVYYLNGLTEGETYKLISPSDTKLSSRLVFSLLDEDGNEEGYDPLTGFQAPGSGIVKIKVLTKSYFSTLQLNSGDYGEFQVYQIMNNNPVNVLSLPISIRLRTTSDNFQKDGFIFPILFDSLINAKKTSEGILTPTTPVALYKNHRSYESLEKSEGLIWEKIYYPIDLTTKKTEISLLSSLIISPSDNTYYIKGYSLNKNFYGILPAIDGLSTMISSVNLYVHDSSGNYVLYDKQLSEKQIKETWDHEKELSEEYSFIIEISVNGINNNSIFENKSVGNIKFNIESSSTPLISLSLVSRPQSIVLGLDTSYRNKEGNSLRPYVYYSKKRAERNEKYLITLHLPVKIVNGTTSEIEEVTQLIAKSGESGIDVKWFVKRGSSSIFAGPITSISTKLVFEKIRYQEYRHTTGVLQNEFPGLYLKFSGEYVGDDESNLVNSIINDTSAENMFIVEDIIYMDTYKPKIKYPYKTYSTNPLIINSGGWKFASNPALNNILFGAFSAGGHGTASDYVWKSVDGDEYLVNTDTINIGIHGEGGTWISKGAPGSYPYRKDLQFQLISNNCSKENIRDLINLDLFRSNNGESIWISGNYISSGENYLLSVGNNPSLFICDSSSDNKICQIYIYGESTDFYYLSDEKLIANFKRFPIKLIKLPGSSN